MVAKSSRLELHIDVLDMADQRALAMPELLPRQLVQAILDEFRELEYLGKQSSSYRLVSGADGSPLDEAKPLGVQLQTGARLALLEAEVVPPPGTEPPPRPAYLREMGSGQVFRLGWLPAIIGRTSENQPMNELVAVDLQSFPTGLRVSRRHVMVTAEDGDFFAACMSTNPAWLIPVSPLREHKEAAVPLAASRLPLLSGDVIRLERSDISLKFIVPDATLTVEPDKGPEEKPAEPQEMGGVE